MKLAVVLSRFPFPLEKGDKLRAYHQIKELSKKHEIYLFCLSDQEVKEDWKTEVQQFCKELHVFRLNTLLIAWNTARQIFTELPFQVGYFYQRGIHKKINQHIGRIKPDHIYCQLVRSAEYVKNFHTIRKTIDYMDALGLGMQRRSVISRGILRWLFAAEGRRLTAYENRIFDYFDGHTAISEQDRQFINHPQNRDIAIVENGTDDRFFDYVKKVPVLYDLVFVGNLNYPPNIECAEFIAREILPDVRKVIPTASLLLSGANPHKRVRDLSRLDGITVSGWVDDIRESYASAKIFTAPLFIGSGMQNKLLEAMALEIPCITTPLANNALKAVKNEHIFIAGDRDKFVETILHLLKDKALASSVACAGKEFVQARFQWPIAVKKLEEVLERK